MTRYLIIKLNKKKTYFNLHFNIMPYPRNSNLEYALVLIEYITCSDRGQRVEYGQGKRMILQGRMVDLQRRTNERHDLIEAIGNSFLLILHRGGFAGEASHIAETVQAPSIDLINRPFAHDESSATKQQLQVERVLLVGHGGQENLQDFRPHREKILTSDESKILVINGQTAQVIGQAEQRGEYAHAVALQLDETHRAGANVEQRFGDLFGFVGLALALIPHLILQLEHGVQCVKHWQMQNVHTVQVKLKNVVSIDNYAGEQFARFIFIGA